MTEIDRLEGQVTTRDGVALAYTLARPANRDGATRRIVMVHSLALDASVWAPVEALLCEEAEVLRYDCRGHGRSGRPAGPYDIAMFGDDLANLLDQIGWSSAVVAGCSMGGCVAQAFAARHPQRVEGLVLVDTTDWYGPDAPTTWRKRGEVARRDGLASMAAFQTTRWFGDAFREQHPDIVSAAMAVFVANDLDAYAATCAMLGDADLRGNLAGIDYPVAIIVGEQDYATPPAAARELRERIPGATIQVIENARHLTPIEEPKVIAAAIRTVTNRAGAGERLTI
jgi:3-oxoadipate enol-lactonase